MKKYFFLLAWWFAIWHYQNYTLVGPFENEIRCKNVLEYWIKFLQGNERLVHKSGCFSDEKVT